MNIVTQAEIVQQPLEDDVKAPYALQDSRVLYEGREELKRVEVNDAVWLALKRKLRMGRHYRTFEQMLNQYGEAAITWDFTREVGKRDDHWATMQAWKLGNGQHHLYCVGPQAEAVIEKINVALDPSPKWLKKKLKNEKRKVAAKPKKKKKKKNQHAAPKRKVKGRKYFPAPISLELNELLTPQFRKSRLFWNEALEMAKYVFEVRGNWKYTARERVARELWDSLARSGYRFAQFKRRGFCLRFDLIMFDGRPVWRGIDLTAVKVSCTKENQHPAYRRTRAWLRGTLNGLPKKTQVIRRNMLFAEIRVAA